MTLVKYNETYTNNETSDGVKGVTLLLGMPSSLISKLQRFTIKHSRVTQHVTPQSHWKITVERNLI